MKFFAISLIMFVFVEAALAGPGRAASAAEGSCLSQSHHVHQFSDVRMAVIEVDRVDQCGFSFADLEEQTVGLDNNLLFASDFIVVRIETNTRESTYRKIDLTKSAVKKGMRAIAVYCSACKAAFSLKPIPNSDHGVPSFGN